MLKVVGRDLLHKSDVGGVAVHRVGAGADLPAAADELLAAVRGRAGEAAVEGCLACAFVPHRANQPGQEVLLSLRQDPAFGPVVVVGVGGLLTEWYGRGTGGRSRLILPAAGLDAAAAEAALTAHPLLSLLCRPSRLYATPPLDPAVLARSVADLAALAAAFAADGDGLFTLEEIEVNPAVPDGGRLRALDGVGLVSSRRWSVAARPPEKVDKLLRPRSAVVLGASAKGVNPGRIIVRNLKASPGVPAEALWIVHPKEREIDGVPCVPGLADLPRPVDLAVVCVPAEAARDAIAELVARDLAAAIILIPGGFAEAGHGELAAEIEALLREGHAAPGGGPVMVGGNCLGIVSRDEYNTFFLPAYKLPFSPARAGGNLALVSQSGAYVVTFASNYDGLVFPRASISFGNQMDLTAGDFLRHFRDDDDVDVIACYVEGFRSGDGARFTAAAREAAARGKRVIVYKAGRTPLGAKAAASHTASLAGDYDVARACLESAGVVGAEDLGDFEDLIKTFTMLHARPVRGRRVGIISNAGFECSAVMDALSGLEVAPYPQETRAELDACLPSFAHRDNPVDATPMADTAAYARSVAAILDSAEVDCAVLSSVPVTAALDNLPADPGRHGEDLNAPESQPQRFVRLIEASAKPAVVVVDSGPLYDPMVRVIEAAGVPGFRKIDRAARALAAFVVSAPGAGAP